jgi:cytochrome c-type biogenesis protein CcmH
MNRFLAMLFALALSFAASAKEATPLAEDPVVEQRLVKLAEELRCLVCQNESLAASRADLAEDLRREIRELIRSGKSDKEIKEYLVQRYGDFVLYRPPVKDTTVLLWGGPFVLLAGGAAGLFFYLRRRRSRVEEKPLSDAEHKRAANLLGDGGGPA